MLHDGCAQQEIELLVTRRRLAGTIALSVHTAITTHKPSTLSNPPRSKRGSITVFTLEIIFKPFTSVVKLAIRAAALVAQLADIAEMARPRPRPADGEMVGIKVIGVVPIVVIITMSSGMRPLRLQLRGLVHRVRALLPRLTVPEEVRAVSFLDG